MKVSKNKINQSKADDDNQYHDNKDQYQQDVNLVSFLKADINYGLVIRIPLEHTDRLKEMIIQEGGEIIYQRVSTERLYIYTERKE
jgi:uncharacterized protein YeeX (DUF496 family)